MSNIKRHMCTDCGIISLPQDKKYCSYCDPDEHVNRAQLINNMVPAGVNAYQEGYEAGYQEAMRRMGG